MEGAATDPTANFLEGQGGFQMIAEEGDDFFDAFGSEPLLAVTKHFLAIGGDKKKFGGEFQGFALIPEGLGGG